MTGRRSTPEQIIAKLRQVEVLTAGGAEGATAAAETQPPVAERQWKLAKLASESEAPLPDALVDDGDARLGEDQLDATEAQAEDMIKPDAMADDLGREAVPGAGGGLTCHCATLA
jgi:hypothetical protein